jgi:hypothetical protein
MANDNTDTSDSARADGPPESRLAWTLASVAVLLAFAFAAVTALTDPRPAPPKAAPLGAEPPSASAVTTWPLTVGDVRSVLGDLDYAPSDESSRAAYDTAVARLTRSVDLVGFARATLQATSTILWTDLGESAPRRVRGAEKDALVAEAIARWHVSALEGDGEEAPLADVFASVLYPPTVPDRNRIDSLTDVMAQGLEPLGLMFGAREATLGWNWRVVGVSVVGTDTAEVAYEATATPRAGFSFADPAMRYTKLLEFAPTAAGRWRLTAWTNYHSVRERFEGNVRSAGMMPPVHRWWGAL